MKKTLFLGLSLLAPYALWCWENHQFLLGKSFLGLDARYYFHWLLYHFENIRNGVYPLWNPFHAWGLYDYMHPRITGEFNPFLLIIPGALQLGLSPAQAFMAFIFTYAFVFFIGFYTLTALYTKDKTAAFLGYVALMFSSFYNGYLFFQPELLTIFTPMVWFFVFWIQFTNASTPRAMRYNATAMLFTAILILTTYLPFYFITTACCLFLGALIFFPTGIKKAAAACWAFLSTQPKLACLSLTLIAAAAYPGIDAMHHLKDPQNILLNNARFENTSGNTTAVSLRAINEGALFNQSSLEELLSGFSSGTYNAIYVSTLIFFLCFFFLFNPSHPQQRMLLSAALFIFTVAVGNIFKWQNFLFDHVAFLHLFRNYMFFWPVLIAMFILFVSYELKTFIGLNMSSPRPKALLSAWAIVCAGIMIVFLKSLDDVPLTSFIMIISTTLWLLAWVHADALRKRPSLFVLGLCVIGIVQPLQVLPFFRNYAIRHFSSSNAYPRYPLAFNMTRPAVTPADESQDCYFYLPKLRHDDAGFCGSNDYGQKRAYLLKHNLPHDTLDTYVQHKFALYHGTQLIDGKNPDWNLIKKAFVSASFKALVENPKAVQEESSPALYADATDTVKVTAFDPNQVLLKTNFSQKTFLVYNDSYHDQWRVFIDHKQAPLYIANYAFKGVWVDAGAHTVHFIFSSRLKERLYFYLIFIMFGFLLWTIYGAWALQREDVNSAH